MGTPDYLAPTPQQCTDRWHTLMSQPKFLGWIVYQIVLAMRPHSHEVHARSSTMIKESTPIVDHLDDGFW